MTDPRVDKLADILVNYSIKVQPDEWIVVNSHVAATPLVEAVLAHIYRAGGHGNVMLATNGLQEIRLRETSEAQLQWVGPVEQIVFEQADAFISIGATDNTRTLTNIDPKRSQMAQLARRELLQIFEAREAEGKLRWVGTQFPCEAYAQEADMSLREYEDFVYGATFADKDDPVASWQAVHDMQQRLIDWLAGKKDVVVRGPNIDMTLSIEGRTFINSAGTHNMPSGEIFTSPVEDSAEGWVRFTYPAIRGGREVEGVEFKFEKGKIVAASAKKNEAYLLSQLDADPGARFLGEFAVGTNYGIQKFTKSILYDEKIGGTIHMAIGRGFLEAGSKNQSAIHWDFICDMRQDSEILIDGELFYKNGQFQL